MTRLFELLEIYESLLATTDVAEIHKKVKEQIASIKKEIKTFEDTYAELWTKDG